MKIVKVTYTAKPEYVAQNQKNIQQVMSDLQQINNANILYHCCLSADGKSFTHTAFFKTEEAEKVLQALPSFKSFQQQLQANGIETPPKQEFLTLVGASKELHN